MNEAYCCNLLKKYLGSKGCFVIKHADKSTVGVPDLSVSIHGFTVWVETKLLRYAKPPEEIRLASKLEIGAQFITMLRLQEYSKAIYFFFVNDRKTCFVQLPTQARTWIDSGEKLKVKYLPMEKLADLALLWPIGLVDGNDLEVVNVYSKRTIGSSNPDKEY